MATVSLHSPSLPVLYRGGLGAARKARPPCTESSERVRSGRESGESPESAMSAGQRP